MVVELIDDVVVVFDIVSEVLRKGKYVVFVNKKLIVYYFDELIDFVWENGVFFLYEVVVVGFIFVICNLEEYYNNDLFLLVSGIVNGMINYILMKISNGIFFVEVLFDV